MGLGAAAGVAAAAGLGSALAGGGGGSPTPPAPIDPSVAINAQAAANRVNQYTPTGNIQWQKGPGGLWGQTTTLTGPQQQLLNQGQDVGLFALNNLHNNPMQLDNGVNTFQFNKVDNNGVPVKSLGSAGPMQSSLNFSGIPGIPQANNQAYNQAVNSVYNQATSRLNPQWQQDQTRLETQLTDQGIPQNSDAWNRAMTQFQQGKNDAYNSAFNNAVTQGQQVESNLFNMGLQANQAGVGNALTAGNFANSAQAQNFNQLLGSGNFANSAAMQRLQQALASSGFNNNANQQGFQNNMANAQLNNASEAQRIQQYLSEMNAGNMYGHVSQPNTGTPIDAMGAYSLAGQEAMANYQAQTQANSAKNGGIGSLLGTLGSAAIMSDRRVKRDIERIGEINGLPLYAYRYAWSKKREVGVMAQDVERKKPHAVITIGGVKHVDYQKAFAA